MNLKYRGRYIISMAWHMLRIVKIKELDAHIPRDQPTDENEQSFRTRIIWKKTEIT